MMAVPSISIYTIPKGLHSSTPMISIYTYTLDIFRTYGFLTKLFSFLKHMKFWFILMQQAYDYGLGNH